MNEHYFSAPPLANDEQLHSREVVLRGKKFHILTADRVFSHRGVDLGTQVLLGVVPVPKDVVQALDLGCGWGPISLSLAAECPEAKVWAVDVNPRAVELTARNAQLAGLNNVQTFAAQQALQQACEQAVAFDLIWSNPPVRIGKEAMHQMLSSWLKLLSPKGVAWLVVQKNLGADSLATWLTNQGWQCEKYASRKGFRVLKVTR